MDRPEVKKDQLARYFILPERVVAYDPGGGQIDNLESLLVTNNDDCLISCNSGDSPWFVIDFGQELNGGIRIDLADPEPADPVRVRIRFGESVSEVMSLPDKDHVIHDVTLDLPVMGSHEFGKTGFRFVRLDFINLPDKLHVNQLKAVALERPLEYKGFFESSDRLLNDIWKIGARTVHLCCQDYILDGIKRDRMLWMGDVHPQIHVIASVFGDIDIVNESMDHIYDITEKNNWMNGHSAYSLWWLISMWDWFYITGDLDWLNSKIGQVTQVGDLIIDHIDHNGWENLTGVRFIDWSIGFNESIVRQGLQALIVWALRSACNIFEVVKDEKNYDKYVKYVEWVSGVKSTDMNNKQVNALRVLAGIEDPVKANQSVFSVKPFNGLSTWFSYYVLKARALAGDYVNSLDFVRKYWGSMLELGAKSFWEHFEIDWVENGSRIDSLPEPGKIDVHAECGDHCFKGHRHSLCHGWAGGVTAWLSTNILGVKILEPGFKKVEISPQLVDLKFVQGAYPTPLGTIELEHKLKDNGKIETNVDAPDGIEIVIKGS
jgi:hypothetical protein